MEEVPNCQVGQSKFMNCIMAFMIKNAARDDAIETSVRCSIGRLKTFRPFDIMILLLLISDIVTVSFHCSVVDSVPVVEESVRAVSRECLTSQKNPWGGRVFSTSVESRFCSPHVARLSLEVTRIRTADP